MNTLLAEAILDSLNDGLYICDRERRILYWNKSAERITGWSEPEMVGRRCHDNLLCHIDQDGRHLCGEEFCPLYRCMVTDRMGTYPVVVFGRTKSGGRIPLEVSVAPLHDPEGRVIGGVETFRDFSTTFENRQRARRIQTLAMEHDLPPDSRIEFMVAYLPHDLVGGDFYALRRLDADRYAFFLADVMGHGEAAALHTMHLSSLWNRYCHALDRPARFADKLNRELCRIVKDESFATGICGVVDAGLRTVRIASAGGPAPLVVRQDGAVQETGSVGYPFGMLEGADYQERHFSCAAHDSLLVFTDGAFEIHDAAGEMLGTDGLLEILKSQGYPAAPVQVAELQRALLRFSNEIRLKDDLTLMEIRFR